MVARVYATLLGLPLLALAMLPQQARAQSVVTFGSTGYDYGYDVTVDASGNAVATGSFGGTVDFDPGPGVVSRSSTGSRDVFVARYAPDGSFVSVFTFGGPVDGSFGRSLAVDAAGNTVVTGEFASTVDFDPGPGVVSRSSLGGTADVFVARYAADGTFISVATFGNFFLNYRSYGVAFDPLGNAVVTGTFSGTTDFDPGPGDAFRTSAGAEDVYVARYAADGSLVSIVTFGGLGPDFGRGVAVDAVGNAVVTGEFQSTVDFDPGPGDASRFGTLDLFVARYAADGTFISVATTDGGGVSGYDVALDALSNAVVTGQYGNSRADFDPGSGVVSRTHTGDGDVFVARYAPNGSFLNVITVGGPGEDSGLGVAVDALGNAVVTGYSVGMDFDPGPGVVFFGPTNTVRDAFVARYAADGTFVSAVSFGSTDVDQGEAVAVDASGNAVVTGEFVGTVDFDPGVGEVNRTAVGGSTDVFLARYTAPGGLLPVELVSFTASADGRTARLAWSTASETNNAGFVVEHQTATGWAEAAPFVAGRGTTSERADYSATVNGLAAGTHAFRLRQIDTDGASALSAVVRVEIATASSGLVVLGQRTVRVELAGAESNLRVRLYDVLGREVARLFEGATGAGSVEASVPSGLAPGVYLVRAEGARFAETASLVLR